ncbi:hypothetical protein ACFXDD_02055 [Streptomyces anthocyanicus]|uniref:hypothetical protein n=1 Tax=Streptomyces TaxID=1883 RepID=UPI0036AAD06F
MANLADEYGTDVEISITALTTTIHAETPTGAPAGLHSLLEQLGLERHEYPTGEPLYVCAQAASALRRGRPPPRPTSRRNT